MTLPNQKQDVIDELEVIKEAAGNLKQAACNAIEKLQNLATNDNSPNDANYLGMSTTVLACANGCLQAQVKHTAWYGTNGNGAA